jgi:uncharacterized protein (TIGR02118 family)
VRRQAVACRGNLPAMVKLTCLVRRKPGMPPEEFHAYWRDHHGPLVASTRSGSHVVRYEQHHRPLDDYGPEDDGGYDGVTVQWFESMDAYRAHIGEDDFATVWADLPKFLDVDRLAFVVTEEADTVVVVAGDGSGR